MNVLRIIDRLLAFGDVERDHDSPCGSCKGKAHMDVGTDRLDDALDAASDPVMAVMGVAPLDPGNRPVILNAQEDASGATRCKASNLLGKRRGLFL
ncbi:hypothetical protein SAMN05518849_1463 [Sphingobium sp. AP50]|nr:hypothetical protein SAMN05518849_1463 [Sphingobium sp. AP50]